VPVTVDGSFNSIADFASLNGALLAVAGQNGNWTIDVAPGIYNELVNYQVRPINPNRTITINGTGNAPFGRDVVIQWANNEQMNPGGHTRASFRVSGINLVLKNISLINTTVRTGTGNWQAETLFFADGVPANLDARGLTVAAFNSSFLSYQDTIQTTGRAWFYRCYIAGDVDYIWGSSTAALFEKNELVSIRDTVRDADAIIFVARTPAVGGTIGKGYVLLDSTVTTRETVVTWFGRNPGGSGVFYDQAAIINTNFVNEGFLSRIGFSGWRLDGGRYQFLAGNNEHVGWKIHGITLEGQPFEVPAPLADTTVMTAALVEAEYSNRHSILNRVFNITSGVYQDLPQSAIWDISSLEEAFGIGGL
jgi:pectin methylesterase-like acyl-CoA thioesterase